MNTIACIKAFSNKHPLPASLLGAIAITVFILAGCKTPTSEGIFQGRTAPTVEEPKYISERNAPSQRQDSVTVKIPQGEAELDPLNIVNSGSGVPRGSKVVISLPHLPDSVTKTEAKANESNALSSFRANGFYNQAEHVTKRSTTRRTRTRPASQGKRVCTPILYPSHPLRDEDPQETNCPPHRVLTRAGHHPAHRDPSGNDQGHPRS